PKVARRKDANGDVPHALTRLHTMHRRNPLRSGHASEDNGRALRDAPFRARKPYHRSRPGRLHGTKEARRLLLMNAAQLETPIESFLAQEERKQLLRFTTAGSVDDGKSTLIGRLLYDSKGVYEDQLASVKKASVNRSAGA